MALLILETLHISILEHPYSPMYEIVLRIICSTNHMIRVRRFCVWGGPDKTPVKTLVNHQTQFAIPEACASEYKSKFSKLSKPYTLKPK